MFGLIVLVAIVATGATAWLTARTTSAQLTESATVQKETADLIHRRLTGYASDHGTWEGVAGTVQALGERTGERIRLTTLDGIVIADTDTLAGRTARPLSDLPATVLDPRPQLPATDPSTVLPNVGPDDGVGAGLAVDVGVVRLLAAQRYGIRLAACLTRSGGAVRRETFENGSWVYSAGAGTDPELARDCEERSRITDDELTGDRTAAKRCFIWHPSEPGGLRPTAPPAAVPGPATPGPATPLPAVTPVPAAPTARDPVSEGGNGDAADSALRGCLQRVFTDRLEAVAPVPLQLKLGFGSDGSATPSISPARVLAAAGAVAILVIAATVLLSRRVLAPIAALNRAARRLGAGDLSERVRVQGGDELAELAASFNRMADSLQQSEERQRRMISDIAHELRTPLANIRGYLEALHDGVLHGDPELFSSLHEEAVLQQRLIDDLQELVLAEAGTLPLHRSPLDLAELLETCGAAHRASAATAGVRLRIETVERTADRRSGAPPTVDGDPDRLRQVIGNLVTNAVRATAAGGSVVLSTFREDTDAVVTVRDTGHGMAPEHLPHVFDRFWRADSARDRRTGGRGLGLAIAREIVLAHGGTLTAESSLGVGSVFTIRLPAGTTGSPVGTTGSSGRTPEPSPQPGPSL